MLKLTALTALVALTACGATSPPPVPARTAAAFPGTRGVNVHGWFTWTRQVAPGRYAYPAFQRQPGELSPGEVAKLKAAGFDFVRLTVDPGVFLQATDGQFTESAETLASGVRRLRDAGLAVIVDLHPLSVTRPDPLDPRAGVAAIQLGPTSPVAVKYRDTAARLAGIIDRAFGASKAVAFEMINEPSLPCESLLWRAQQRDLHAAVRRAAPRVTLVVTGGCYGVLRGLTNLKASDFNDPNLLYSFHFYESYTFTSQGTGFDTKAKLFTSGLPYPWNARPRDAVIAELDSRLQLLPDGGASVRPEILSTLDRYLGERWDRQKIDERMDAVLSWAAANGVRRDQILMGEFGVNGSAGLVMGTRSDDKAAWLHDVSDSAGRHGFRWSLWLLAGGPNRSDAFELLDRETGRMDPVMLKAIGLRTP